jgi:hypothetical protein
MGVTTPGSRKNPPICLYSHSLLHVLHFFFGIGNTWVSSTCMDTCIDTKLYQHVHGMGCILATADTKVEINLCLWGLATKGLLTEANALTMEPLPPMQACMPLAICRRIF